MPKPLLQGSMNYNCPLQDQAIACPPFFTELIADCLFNRELEYFIYSVILFRGTFDVLCSH